MAPRAPPQRCLYEVLEVDKDAEDDAVKKAYRRMALQWHPGAVTPDSPPR